MNIVIFTHEFPYPPNNGGRVDIWNRLKALHLSGHKIFFIAWSIYEDNQKADNIEAVEKVVDKLIVFKRNNDFINRFWNLSKKLALLCIQPNIVTDCQLDKSTKKNLLKEITEFHPDLFISDAVFAAETTQYFAKKLATPFFIRSHNIEHLYVKKQLKNAPNIKAIFKLGGTYINLKKYETKIFGAANGVLDISIDDIPFWQNKGIKNIRWCPPVFFSKDGNTATSADKKIYDICYVGNLYNPNNIQGLFWLINDVLPLIKQQIPNIKIVIAGSKPIPEIINLCKLRKIKLIANPVSVDEVYAQSKILVNPTLFGSGVNLKTVEQLFVDVPVVCTSTALKGLPPEFKQVFNVADSANDFSDKINYLLTNVYTTSQSAPSVTNLNLRSFFSVEYYDRLLHELLAANTEIKIEEIA